MTEPVPSFPLAGAGHAETALAPLELLPRFEFSRTGRRLAMGGIAIFFLLCIAAIVAFGFFTLREPDSIHAPLSVNSPLKRARFDRLPGKDAAEIAASTGVGKDALEKLSAEDAMAVNARIPAVGDVGPAAQPFVVPLADGKAYLRALDCLTSAIYYEAVNEPIDGQRAVAQVVINRVRHVSYPKSVCGVVYQGATRRTGCQFSFTCDGSLARRPSAAGWARSRSVARAALAGSVDAAVGLATHYHADYVFPYWAPTLVRQKIIGRHIFYRWPGAWGTPPSFAGAYQQAEPDVWNDEKYLAGKALPVQAEMPVIDEPGGLVKPADRPVLPLAGAAETPSAKAAGEPGKEGAYLVDRKSAAAGKDAPAKPAAAQPASVTGGVIMPEATTP